MSKSFFLIFLSLLFPILSQADFQCRYAIEAKKERRFSEVIEEFKEESALEAPKMMMQTKCGTPICVGSLACLRNGYPIAVMTAACKAVQVAGKWTCPTAQTCYDDKDVAHDQESLPGEDDVVAQNGKDAAQKNQSSPGTDSGVKK